MNQRIHCLQENTCTCKSFINLWISSYRRIAGGDWDFARFQASCWKAWPNKVCRFQTLDILWYDYELVTEPHRCKLFGSFASVDFRYNPLCWRADWEIFIHDGEARENSYLHLSDSTKLEGRCRMEKQCNCNIFLRAILQWTYIAKMVYRSLWNPGFCTYYADNLFITNYRFHFLKIPWWKW